MYKTFTILLLLSILLLTACSPSPEALSQAIAGTQAAIPTQTAYPTFAALPTYTPYPTYTSIPTYTPIIILVTPASSPTPLYTSTVTPIPSETPLPSKTPDLLKADKEPGNYLVNVDIAPGVWRNNGTSDSCYWERDDKKGKIIDNHYGQSGGTMYIAPSDFTVELDEECGTWTYLQAP